MDRLAEPDGPTMTFDVASSDGNAVVTVRGELDISNVDQLEAAVAPILETKPDRLIVDLGGLRFADSSAHAQTAFDLMVARRQGEIRVEVTDHANGTPAMRSPGPDDPTGRGLQIVNLLAQAWGVEYRKPEGTTVWFTVAAPSAVAQKT